MEGHPPSRGDRRDRGENNRGKGGKAKKAHPGDSVEKVCADCSKAKKRDAFSKTQWARDERRCAECIGTKAVEEHETDVLKEVVPDDVPPLSSEGLGELLAHGFVMEAVETLEMQADQGCSDRGRPGTCTSLEYCVMPFDVTGPRLSLHPLLFLRSMSYVGHYHKQGITFATPSLVLQCPLMRNLPRGLEEQLRPASDRIVSSLRVWSFRDCPPSINMLSHGFVFAEDPKAKEHRNVEMGCFGAVGVAQRSLPVGRMHPKLRVSVHRSRGMMACSPNNAILDLLPTEGHVRRFFILVRDGDRVELTLNVLLTEEADLNAMSGVLERVSKLGNQTVFANACQELFASDNKALFSILSVINTFC
jgi:hypothetical protein